MKGFLGFLGKGDQPIDKNQFIAILEDCFVHPSNKLYIFSQNRFLFGIASEKDFVPKIRETNRYIFFAHGRVDNFELEPLLNNDDLIVNAQFSMNLLIILEKIRGDFIFILYDKQIQNLVCVRDQIGMRPFYYIDDGRFFRFASELSFFRNIPGFSFQMDDRWIADALSTMKSEKDRTPYRGIHRLMPGNILEVKNKLKLRSYWNPHLNEDYSKLDFETASDLFSGKLNEAVKRRLEGCNVVGTELSGGLDSSGITAYAYKNRSSDIQSFLSLSHVISEEGKIETSHFKDESEYSKLLVKELNIKNHLLCSGSNMGILASIKHSIINQSAPTQSTFHFFSDILLEKAKLYGVEKLFSGFGGDEGVSSKANGYFHELIVERRREHFREEYQKYLGRKGIGYFQSRVMSGGYYYLEPFLRTLKGSKSRRRQNNAISALDIIDNQFLMSIGIKNRILEKFLIPDDDTVKGHQIGRVLQDHISHRLESSYLTAKSYGIEYVYPLWDIDLLEFYLNLPVDFKFREGMGRAIYRESLKGMVPEKIRTRDDKSGTTIPTAINRIINDTLEIEKLVRRCKANNRFHYIDYQVLLDRLETQRQYATGRKGRRLTTPGIISPVQILLLQDMQRSGEFDSGICF